VIHIGLHVQKGQLAQSWDKNGSAQFRLKRWPLVALKFRKRGYGDAENAGLENAGLENVGPNRRGGKGRTRKRGNIMCMGSEM